ncbi:MAG: adenylate/guanylate cyclase domain-containing protein [Verrucomicrobia bacterium]|nr:MAG: adenylate/guanylate cyclase domain-containing protein [Verrucomicrobiota bacterium]
MRFRLRVLLLLAGLVATALVVLLAVVNYSAEREAVAEIRRRFTPAPVTFLRVVESAKEQASALASLVAADYAFKRAFADADVPTLESNLLSLLRFRVGSGASAIAILYPDGVTRAALDRNAERLDAPQLFAHLIERAGDQGEDYAKGYVWLGDTLHQFIFVPMFAPEVVAWVGLGIQINDTLAQDLGERAALDVFFVGPRGRMLASTLSPPLSDAFAEALPAPNESPAVSDTQIVTLLGERFLVTRTTLPDLASTGTQVYVLASLDAYLAPTRRLQYRLLFAGAGLLALALLAALVFARSISHPVQLLAAHTRRIALCDYQTRLNLGRRDELGALAEAFNQLSNGLAERDRVRDLLDKNVSPEVAAQLVRDGAALGGEEREVTVLFADLRGFTALAESLPPRELVRLLNRYLDRMSGAIEGSGGVIDKYIGDEIMALFGAPVAATDSADRAVRAALAMRTALAAFNQELSTEGHPVLGFGIGINTARVVAGNIGSHNQLNYSVIGDGVNIAARLQSLTRRADFSADILISEATRLALRTSPLLRDLGEVSIKGKAQAIHIYALG